MKPNVLIASIALLTGTAFAQTITVTDAWVRATVPGQNATGAFMKLRAAENVRLISVSSAAAGVVEVHEMKLDQQVMRMSALPNGLELPAGKTVELKPGGYHVMLMDLKAALPVDGQVALTLIFQDAKGKQTQQELKVPVRSMGGASAHQHKH
ncbi:MAG: copper chaperone PCu(A)C [Alphaproteobacteria bacterium]|nr:copper chaperone PCu(A)C [Alphaproteobacteria bacterium]